jgi:hypothetical protein
MCRVQRLGYGPDNPLTVRYGSDSDPSFTGYCNRGATCWHSNVKGLTAIVNSAANGWRMETFVSTAEGKGSCRKGTDLETFPLRPPNQLKVRLQPRSDLIEGGSADPGCANSGQL